MNGLHQRSKIVSSLACYLGRFKLLIGVISLAAATAILVLSDRRGAGRQGPDTLLRMVPLILASVFSFSFLAKQSDKEAARQ